MGLSGFSSHFSGVLSLQVGFSSSLSVSPSYSRAEYTIYAYDHFQEQLLGQNRWQKLGSLDNPENALEKASNLFKSRQYEKIEIKKTVFDSKSGQNIATTYRVFENHKNRDNYMVFTAALLLAFSILGLIYLQHM